MHLPQSVWLYLRVKLSVSFPSYGFGLRAADSKEARRMMQFTECVSYKWIQAFVFHTMMQRVVEYGNYLNHRERKREKIVYIANSMRDIGCGINRARVKQNEYIVGVQQKRKKNSAVRETTAAVSIASAIYKHLVVTRCAIMA